MLASLQAPGVLHMASPTIAFIGGGNMASCLVGGLVAHDHPADSIWVSDPETARLELVQERFAVQTSADNATAAGRADTVVLAVKPQVMRPVVESIRDVVRESNPLVMSVAAGVREMDIQKWLGGGAAIVRCMPNTPALLGAGATGLYANAQVTATQQAAAESIMRAAGITLWVNDESLLDAVTAVSGSGPAYYFLLMELMEKAGTELGLDSEAARRLTLQTALGAARMALESGEAPGTLRKQVTSPAGTTEAAINSFLANGMEDQVRAALTAARDRAIELGSELGDD
jgi:pyrroline-5-carboxylate reductase